MCGGKVMGIEGHSLYIVNWKNISDKKKLFLMGTGQIKYTL